MPMLAKVDPLYIRTCMFLKKKKKKKNTNLTLLKLFRVFGPLCKHQQFDKLLPLRERVVQNLQLSLRVIHRGQPIGFQNARVPHINIILNVLN